MFRVIKALIINTVVLEKKNYFCHVSQRIIRRIIFCILCNEGELNDKKKQEREARA